MKDTENEKQILSVRVSPAIIKRLDDLVERTGVGRGEIIERCLSVGIVDEEEFVEWLESSVKGPFLKLLMAPPVLKAIFALTGGGIVDKTQQKVAERVSAKRKQKKMGGRPVPA